MRSFLLIPALLMLWAGSAFADSIVLTTVDQYEHDEQYEMRLTGVVQGQSTPSTVHLNIRASQFLVTNCERAVLVMMNRPGRFKLSVVGGPSSSTEMDDARCNLIANH